MNSILETNLTIQGNRLNVITKKVTSWAAIIAVPTFITGFYGMNVPYPGFSWQAGFAASIAIMVIAGLVLYIVFKRTGCKTEPGPMPTSATAARFRHMRAWSDI